MKWLKRRLVNWLLKDTEVERLVVRRLQVGSETVTISTNIDMGLGLIKNLGAPVCREPNPHLCGLPY